MGGGGDQVCGSTAPSHPLGHRNRGMPLVPRDSGACGVPIVRCSGAHAHPRPPLCY